MYYQPQPWDPPGAQAPMAPPPGGFEPTNFLRAERGWGPPQGAVSGRGGVYMGGQRLSPVPGLEGTFYNPQPGPTLNVSPEVQFVGGGMQPPPKYPGGQAADVLRASWQGMAPPTNHGPINLSGVNRPPIGGAPIEGFNQMLDQFRAGPGSAMSPYMNQFGRSPQYGLMQTMGPSSLPPQYGGPPGLYTGYEQQMQQSLPYYGGSGAGAKGAPSGYGYGYK